MRTIQELLSYLNSLDIKLWLNEGHLHYNAPEGVLTSTLRSELAQRKAEIIKFLQPTTILPEIVPQLDQLYKPFPLTDIQQAYWVGRSEAFELGNIGTHFYSEIDVNDLNLKQLNQAWQKLISRHEVLRTVILPSGQQQILRQVPTYEISVLDLRTHDISTINSKLLVIRNQMSHQKLASDQWPLFEIRATLYSKQCSRLHISIDALIADAWSMLLLIKEWSQLYQEPHLSLKPLQLSFRDYVLAEQALQNTQLYQHSWDYWLSRLDTLPPAPDLPLARNPAELKDLKFKRRSEHLNQEIWLQLKSRATEAGLTPSGALLAAFAEVLTVWSKSPRFTLNLTLFNRLPLHPQVNDIIGDFTTLTLLQVDNSSLETFTVRAIRQQQLWQDLDHRYVNGVRVLRELAKKHGGRQATMPVVFTSTLGLGSSGQGALGLSRFGKEIYTISQTPQVWLDCQIFDQDGALAFNWDVVEDLFPSGLMDDMFDAYCRLLVQLANSSSPWVETTKQLLPLSQLNQRAIINANQKQQSKQMLHNLFIAQAETQPMKYALISPECTLSYQQLYELASRVSHRLRQLGASRNTLVAVVMSKSWEEVVAVLGILMSGAAYLPIDPDLPKERRQQLLEIGQVHLVLTHSELNETLAWPENIQRLSIKDENLLSHPFPVPYSPSSIVSPSDLAYVIFTSGSTGVPKGVMISHQAVVNTIQDINKRFGVDHEDRVIALSSLNFDLSVYDIFGTLAAGGTIIIPSTERRKDPSHWVQLMGQHQVTIWNSVPALMQMLVEYLLVQPEKVFSSLRLALLSGDWLPLSLPEQIKALWANVQVVSLGGATEASIWSICYPIEKVEPDWKSIPYGKPLMNQSFHVFNKNLQPCPVWVPGQLYIGGAGLALGYWRDEEKTQASFVIHPTTQERLYKTGDLGRYLPDGNIEFLGREDFQVKVNGYRIELGEIEAVLKQHPAVKEAVVTTVDVLHGNKQLVAYIVVSDQKLNSNNQPQDGDQKLVERENLLIATAPAQQIEAHSFTAKLWNDLKHQLPAYMVPSVCMLLDALPLNANGKIDRKALPKPEIFQSKTEKEIFKLPQTEVEQTLAKIVQEILQIKTVSIYNNFFDLGANSVNLIQIHNKIKDVLNTDVPIVEIFKYPNISFLAKYLSQEETIKPFVNQLCERSSKQREFIKQQKIRRERENKNQ